MDKMGWGMNTLRIKDNEASLAIYKDIISKVILSLLMGFVVSFFIWNSVWNENREFVHTILETISICIGFSIFLILWNRREFQDNINPTLGFGFFIVSIFDFIHMYNYGEFTLYMGIAGGYPGVYWLLARIIQAITLLIFSFYPYYKGFSKYFNIFLSITISSIFFYVIKLDLSSFGNLYSFGDIETTKMVIEFIIIIILIISLLELGSNIQKEENIRFKSLYISIIIIIPSEICFAFFKHLDSFISIYGHSLKVISFYFLYKAVFRGLVKSPYDKLKENNKNLYEILDSMPMAIITYDSNDKISFVNESFERLFKCSKKILLGLDNKEIVEKYNKENNCEVKYENDLPYDLNYKTDNLRNIIRTYKDTKGNEINVIMNTHKINDGILVILNDIKHEQEIENLNLQAQTILNSINVPTMIVDSEDNIVACNSWFINLVNLEDVDISKISIQDLYGILKISCYNDITKSYNKNLNKEVEEWIIETLNGDKKIINATISEINNIQNDIIGKMFVFEDISKRKEEELKLINQEKLALIGQMGATIVHETRNFLSTIKGNSQLVELNVKDEKVKQYAKKINISTDEVNRIISDFLSLSKPKQAVMQEIAARDLLGSIESTIETSSLIKGVEIEFIYNIDDRYILCDESQIKQVLLNACKNATEAMAEVLEPKLVVETGIIEEQHSIYIKISDNGIGMRKETLDRIGTPFFTTKHNGTGLGLSVCFNIIKNHGGYINVNSTEGQGTVFTIILPEIEDDSLDCNI